MSQPEPQVRGRRVAWRGRLDATTAVAAALPLIAAGTALLTTTSVPATTVQPPEQAVLARLDRICPSALPGGKATSVLVTGAVDGEAAVRPLAASRTEPLTVPLKSWSLVSRGETKAALISAEDQLAVGLQATRARTAPLAATPCPTPAATAYFTGLGSRADHASVVEIDNPDVGAAVVDLTLYSRQGDLAEPKLRGVRVSGRTSLRLDLAAIVPRRGDLAMQATVSRGRAAIAVIDSVSVPGQAPKVEWLQAQPEAATSNSLLGLPPGGGRRSLLLGNPGADEVVATLKVITPDSIFAPTGTKELRVRPGGLGVFSISQLLRGPAGKDAIGLLVESEAPLTASLRSEAEGDLALTTAATPITDLGSAVFPAGQDTLLLAAGASATARLTVRDAQGRALLQRTVKLTGDRGVSLDLPKGATSLEIKAEGDVRAAVLLRGKGSAVVGVAPVPQHSLVPHVEPGRP